MNKPNKNTLLYGIGIMLTLFTLACNTQKKETAADNPQTEATAETGTPARENETKVATPTVGTLTVYYATEDFTVEEHEYHKGFPVYDSNDPFGLLTDADADNYKYETNEASEETYSWLIPKAKVRKETYTMNQLPVSLVADKTIFKSEDGLIAKIFKSDINGHKYYSFVSTDEGWETNYNEEETKLHDGCLVLTAEYVSRWDGEKYQFDLELQQQDGNVVLYEESRYSEGTSPGDIRHRDGVLGLLEEKWSSKEG